MKKLYKLLMRNENCVLLKRIDIETYKVRDIENDDIYIGCSYENALDRFKHYDINEVRKKRKELFEEWLTEFAKA